MNGTKSTDRRTTKKKQEVVGLGLDQPYNLFFFDCDGVADQMLEMLSHKHGLGPRFGFV